MENNNTSEPIIYTGKVIPCPVCSKTVAATAKTCPNCGGRVKKSNKGLFILLGVLGFLWFAYVAGDRNIDLARQQRGANGGDTHQVQKRIAFAQGLSASAIERQNITTYSTRGIKSTELYINNKDITDSDCNRFSISDYGRAAGALGFVRVVCINGNLNAYSTGLDGPQ